MMIKFIAPNILEIPAKWRLKIAKSTAPPEWDWIPDNGGYTVQPVNLMDYFFWYFSELRIVSEVKLITC